MFLVVGFRSILRQSNSMTIAFIIFLRLFVPLLMLRKPLLGAVLAVVADSVDYIFYSQFGWGVLGGPGIQYQMLDKVLDTYYLGLEVSLVRWWKKPLYRVTAYALFIWRIVGVLTFFFFQNEIVLVIFPNIFETFFIITLISGQYKQKTPKIGIFLGVMAICITQKLLHEYALHITPIDWLSVFN